MMAMIEGKQRPANSHKLWWCPDCDAQFSENHGQWMRGFEYSEGTMPAHRFDKTRDVPKDVCVNCESKNIHGPTE